MRYFIIFSKICEKFLFFVPVWFFVGKTRIRFLKFPSLDCYRFQDQYLGPPQELNSSEGTTCDGIRGIRFINF